MSVLFNKVVIEDKKRIDGIKTILIDYFLAEKAKAMNHVKLIQSSLEYIKGVDKEHDTNDFIKRFAHIQSNVISENQTPPNSEKKKEKKAKNVLNEEQDVPQDVSFNFSESETFSMHFKELSDLIFTDIVLCGKVYRRGRILASNWKPIHANITKFGWFHAFEKAEDLKPIVSVCLSRTSIHIKDNDQNAKLFSFEIVVP